MYYAEPIYRPPSEAGSLLVQATVGCASAARGQCYFCGSWVLDRVVPEKKFRVRPIRDIVDDLEEARASAGSGVRRIFFLDSNAMVMRTRGLVEITERAYALFPHLERVSVYACASDILRKPPQDLARIREAGLKLLYVGLESGNEQVLGLHNKGSTVEETAQACLKAREAGLEVSVTVILGLGGRGLSRPHAVDTGRAISRMQPDYVGALTLMAVPGTPVEDWIREGTFEVLSQEEILEELRLMLENVEVRRKVVFRTNHASNYLPLRGDLPSDRERMLETIRKAQARKIPLRPESVRGL
ncbi:MAG: radical SAM protein [bacterium]